MKIATTHPLASFIACTFMSHTHGANCLQTHSSKNRARMQPPLNATRPTCTTPICYNPLSPTTSRHATYPPLLSYLHPIFTTLDRSNQTRVTATLTCPPLPDTYLTSHALFHTCQTSTHALTQRHMLLSLSLVGFPFPISKSKELT